MKNLIINTVIATILTFLISATFFTKHYTKIISKNAEKHDKALREMYHKYQTKRWDNESLNDSYYKLKYAFFKATIIEIKKKGFNTVEYYVTNGFPAIVNIIYDNPKTDQYIRWHFPESLRNPLNYVSNFFNTNHYGFTIQHVYRDWGNMENSAWTCHPDQLKEYGWGTERALIKKAYSLLPEYHKFLRRYHVYRNL